MTEPETAPPPTHSRHVVLALVVGAYMITYMDRVNLASAVPVIQRDMGFSMITIGWIFASFRWGYALFQIPGGWLGDRIGGRRALSLVVVWWSIFTSLTAFAWNAAAMGVFRFFFGMGEAGAFPIATRSLSGWMLAKARGFAPGGAPQASGGGGGLNSGIGRASDDPIRMAHAVLCFRPDRTCLGGGLVLVLPRHPGGTPSLQCRGTASDRRIGRHTKIRYPEGPVAQHTSQPLALDAFADVLLLRI